VGITLSEQKTKKKQKQELVQKEKKADAKNIQKLVQRLDELKKKGKEVDVAVCPKCKSVNLRRVESIKGDMTGHLGWLPVMYECLDCGWRGRLEIFATNKKQSWREVAIMAEARDLQVENKTKEEE
jgi:RNase P subunit RPR2